MSTLEATVSMLEVLSEDDLIRVQNFAKCLFMSQNTEYPFPSLSKSELMDQLSVSQKQYEQGKYMDAEVFENQLMEKYGL